MDWGRFQEDKFDQHSETQVAERVILNFEIRNDQLLLLQEASASVTAAERQNYDVLLCCVHGDGKSDQQRAN